MFNKNDVISALNTNGFFMIETSDKKKKIRLSNTSIGFDCVDVFQLDVGTHHEEYGIAIQNTVYFRESEVEFNTAFDLMCSIFKNSDIELVGKTRDEVEIEELGLLNVSHYKYLDAVIESFWVKVFGKTPSEMFCGGIVSAHGDKCFDYKFSMPKRNIPFNRSALLFLLTYTKLMDREKHLSEEWVVENYNKYVPLIIEAEQEFIQKLNKA